MQRDRKIIYLGFQKCGTTSFWRFFEAHGFRVIHNTLQVCQSIGLSPDAKNLRDLIDPDALARFVKPYDVLTDNPFPVLYEHLDNVYPNARFVLGTRATDEWLGSMQRYFGTRMPALGHALYSSDLDACADPERFCNAIETHNAGVRSYFDGRSDFLEISLGVDSNEKISRDLEEFAGLPTGGAVAFGRHRPA